MEVLFTWPRDSAVLLPYLYVQGARSRANPNLLTQGKAERWFPEGKKDGSIPFSLAIIICHLQSALA